MEFQDNQNIQKSDNTLTNIILIALGVTILYFLFKGSQAQQPVGQVQAQYENAEEWHIQRGNDGYIEDLRVGRHANVGNGNVNGNVNSSGSYINNTSNYLSTDNSNSINRTQLDKYIKNLIAKNLSEMSITNNKERIIYDDRERRQRFGFN